MAIEYVPRPAQQRILEYAGGYMGVSAVPGSGKTFTLSMLAAQLVGELTARSVYDEQEVLVVTFTNSAVENFQNRIASILRERQGLLAGVGYRVRTLHGLAHDIVRERPSLAGLSEDFGIVDERTRDDIVEEATISYLRSNPDAVSTYIDPEILRSNRNIDGKLQRDMIDIAQSVIRTIKDNRLDYHELQESFRRQAGEWPLLKLGIRVYTDYQRSLDLRGAVDFADLISLSLRVLESDSDYLHRLHDRWPYILEDEAQDSSSLQERLLRMLTARRGNWVRVGDPNQAINTTFTSASTSFLRNFIAQHPDLARDLPDSGRCAQPILDLANQLIDWSRESHPVLSTDEALTLPHIQPTPPGDPQPNPPAHEAEVHLYDKALTPDEEKKALLISLRRWLPENEHRTVAVLAPTQARVIDIANVLKADGLPVDDSLMRTSSETRRATGAIATLLQYLSRPDLSAHLRDVWTSAWWPYKGVRIALDNLQPATDEEAAHDEPYHPTQELPEPVRIFSSALNQLRKPEDFVFPVQSNWTDLLRWMDEVEGFRDLVEEFRSDLRRWTQATVLPIDELLLTIGADLFDDPANLALTHHLAVRLAQIERENESLRLQDLASEVHAMASNRRTVPDFNADAEGYEARPGVITLANMHKAKGLEWDRVYLTSVNTYDFPSGSEDESYRGQAYYARDRLNLEAEVLAQIDQLAMGTLDDYREGDATSQARLDTAAERLRLLYVGITRARSELIITYNTGRYHERDPKQPAVAFQALIDRMAAPA